MSPEENIQIALARIAIALERIAENTLVKPTCFAPDCDSKCNKKPRKGLESYCDHHLGRLGFLRSTTEGITDVLYEKDRDAWDRRMAITADLEVELGL